VIDLGCGEGRLLRELLKHKQFQEIAGMDVSHRSLEVASERLHLDTMPPKQKERIRLFQGSLMYKDKRLAGFEAATVVEVIEHLDRPRSWCSATPPPRRAWQRLSGLSSSTRSRPPSS
jgi:2-polyprenyl-3-methyl-5-hydroxy-6-metoxy-1,4-benzoquinol methylase